MLETKIEKLVRYLKQPSTWQGLTLIAGAAGFTITPEYQAAIMAGGAILLGLLQCFKDDDRANPAEPVTKPMTNMDIVRVVAAAKQKGLLALTLLILPAVMLQGCATGGGAVGDALEQSAVPTAAYLMCKNNPDVIPALQMVCLAPQDQLAQELANLYAAYEGAIEDPFLKMQADIMIQAFMDEYGLDLADPGFDFTTLAGEDLQPFVDMICVGVAAASSAQ